MRVIRACALVVAFGCAGTSPGGPGPELVQGPASCTACRITVDEVWRSGRDQNVLPADFYVEAGSALWAMGGFSELVMVRFPLGRQPSTVFDWVGGGEQGNEIRGVSLDASGDTLIVTQAQLVSYVSARDLSPYRYFTLTRPTGFGLVVLSDGSLVMPTAGRTSTYALHWLGADGQARGSVLPLAPELHPPLLPTALGREPGTVWALLPAARGFTAEQWDMAQDRRLRRLEFQADWWYTNAISPAELEAMAGGGQARSEALKPSTAAIAAYDDGSQLWVTIRHADESWRRALGADLPSASMLFDSFLFALDRETGEVLAGQGFDDFAISFTNRGRLVVIGTDSDRWPFIRLHEVRLTGRRPAG